MKHCCQLNTIFPLVVYCLFLHGELHGYVKAFSSDTNDTGEKENVDPLSIPLISDNGAPLVAMLDTNTINRRIKSYIQTLMKREIYDALNNQVQEDKSTLMRDKIQSSIQEQIQEIFKTSLEENSTIDFIRNIILQEIKEQAKEGMSSPQVVQYKDCTELQRQTKKKLNDGVYTIYPEVAKLVYAYCDMTTDGGGCTVMLKRFGGSVSFKRTWVECENGYGDIHGEFWLGNKYTHMLTSSGKYELRVDMIDNHSNTKYAVYKTFVVGDAASKYKLTVGDSSGNAGDRFGIHNGMKFTTIDQDNDLYYSNCADNNTGSWWYDKCSRCDLTRSNAKPYWKTVVSKPVMMIRKL